MDIPIQFTDEASKWSVSVGSSQLEIPRVHTKQVKSTFSYFAARS